MGLQSTAEVYLKDLSQAQDLQSPERSNESLIFVRDQICELLESFRLRLKSWDEPWKLWYAVLKLKNMVMTQGNMLQAELMFPNPERI
ncbi:hypothetical protein Bca52824_048473 [Brassica carinata]|uniref:Uncharacterized protein n=1 Tax=Brassica carinata TaxID=52824 RepID=A0A8X7US82_BRACI|nr:hypothetical protein Bca52824_048473 [Brassica carinata]